MEQLITDIDALLVRVESLPENQKELIYDYMGGWITLPELMGYLNEINSPE
jgi:hypothetical protein